MGSQKTSTSKVLAINCVEDYNPADYLIDMNDSKYLLVKHRIVWFRLKYPNGTIITNLEKMENNTVVFSAAIYSDSKALESSLLAKAYSYGDFSVQSDYKVFETTETSAVGRALAFAGFGTQFCGNELDEGPNPVDAPVGNENEAKKAKPKAADVSSIVDSDFNETISLLKSKMDSKSAFGCMLDDGSGRTLKDLYKEKSSDPIKDIRKVANRKPKSENECTIIAAAQFLVDAYEAKLKQTLGNASESKVAV